jgi:threonine/homoserine/homoserine lactone efflux protein
MINFSLLWFGCVILLTCIGVAFEKFFLQVEPGRSELFPRGFGLLLMALAVPCTVLIGNATGLLDGPAKGDSE